MPRGKGKGKSRRNSSSARLAKKTGIMKTSCMWGGNSAATGLAGLGATGYGLAINGATNAQTTDGFGGNHIKQNDPAVVWKGGQRGGSSMPFPMGNGSASPDGSASASMTMTDSDRLQMGSNMMTANAPMGSNMPMMTGGKPVAAGTVTITVGTQTVVLNIGDGVVVDDGQAGGGEEEPKPEEVTTTGGSMLGAAVVPAVLLAANQLYKPSRALKNLSFSRKAGFKKTMKKFGKRRR